MQYQPPRPVVGPDFLQQFMVGHQAGLQQREAARRDQLMQQEMQREQMDRLLRQQHLKLQEEEARLRRKKAEQEDKIAQAQRQMEAYRLSQLPPPTAADLGYRQDQPDVGPLVSEINVPQPMMTIPSETGAAPDVQMPILTGRQQEMMAQREAQMKAEAEAQAVQARNREALGLYADKKQIDQRYEKPPEARRPVFEKAYDQSTGKVIFATPEQIAASGGRLTPPPTASMTGEGGKPMLQGEISKFNDFVSGLASLERLSSEVGQTGAGSKAATFIPNAATEAFGWGADSKGRQAVLDQARQVIGKAMEGGVLRREDEIKYVKILPNIGDAPQVAQSKLKNLKRVMAADAEIYLETLEAAGRDVSGVKKQLQKRLEVQDAGAGGTDEEPPDA